jgi:hypothetical protein
MSVAASITIRLDIGMSSYRKMQRNGTG